MKFLLAGKMSEMLEIFHARVLLLKRNWIGENIPGWLLPNGMGKNLLGWRNNKSYTVCLPTHIKVNFPSHQRGDLLKLSLSPPQFLFSFPQTPIHNSAILVIFHHSKKISRLAREMPHISFVALPHTRNWSKVGLYCAEDRNVTPTTPLVWFCTTYTTRVCWRIENPPFFLHQSSPGDEKEGRERGMKKRREGKSLSNFLTVENGTTPIWTKR